MKMFAKIGLFALLLVLPLSTFAATFQADDVVMVGTGETVEDNLYIAGASAVLGGVVNGDAFVFGSNAVIQGEVQDDVMIAGGTVTITGPVHGDLRVAGGTVTIGSAIDGELLVAGGLVQILPGATIAGDVNVVGGQVFFNGEAQGRVDIQSEEARISGTVNGDLHAKTAKPLVIASTGQVNGNVFSASRSEVQVEDGAQIAGEVTFTKWTQAMDGDAGSAFSEALPMLLLMKLLALLGGVVILLFLMPGVAGVMTEKGLVRFWQNALIGFIAMIIVPVLSLILFTTVVGGYLGILLLSAYVFAACAAALLTSVMFGTWLLSLRRSVTGYKTTVWSAVLGVIVLFLIGLIPIVGWLFIFVWWLAAFGVFFSRAQVLFREHR